MSDRPRRRGNPGIVPGERLRHVTVRLPESLIRLAEDLGDKNISAGIRAALERLAASK